MSALRLCRDWKPKLCQSADFFTYGPSKLVEVYDGERHVPALLIGRTLALKIDRAIHSGHAHSELYAEETEKMRNYSDEQAKAEGDIATLDPRSGASRDLSKMLILRVVRDISLLYSSYKRRRRRLRSQSPIWNCLVQDPENLSENHVTLLKGSGGQSDQTSTRFGRKEGSSIKSTWRPLLSSPNLSTRLSIICTCCTIPSAKQSRPSTLM